MHSPSSVTIDAVTLGMGSRDDAVAGIAIV
jgi:hypothetical protein